MATSADHELFSPDEHEISCPICLDVFEEPKCLPSCAHNVCQQCLEGMVKKHMKVIECPVCRVESTLPKYGVAAFAKNHLLVRLIERIPGIKEKQAIKKAMKRCNEKIESAKNALQTMENRYGSAREDAEEMKRRIRSLAEKVVTLVLDQEKDMITLIDRKLSESRNEDTFTMHKSNVTDLCEKASSCVQTVDDIFHNANPRDLKDLKDPLVEDLNYFSEALESGTLCANREFTQPFKVSLSNTLSVEQFIQQGSLGSLSIRTSKQTSPFNSSARKFSMFGSVIRTIDESSSGISKFNPFSLASTRKSGYFVVLDEEAKRVHVFGDEGVHLTEFRIMFGDLWDIAVSNVDEIVVLNRESNRLLHYDTSGNFKKKFVTTPNENVKFTSLSIDLHGRYVVSSSPRYNEHQEETLPCVLVYNSAGNLTLSFRHERLSAAEKAVFHGGKFFVANSDTSSILVFQKDGKFQGEIGKGFLNYPSCLSVDGLGNIVVCDQGSKAVHIFSQEGAHLNGFQTNGIPQKIAFTKNFQILVCLEHDGGDRCVRMLAYDKGFL